MVGIRNFEVGMLANPSKEKDSACSWVLKWLALNLMVSRTYSFSSKSCQSGSMTWWRTRMMRMPYSLGR